MDILKTFPKSSISAGVAAIATLVLAPWAASAASITPSTFSATIDIGETVVVEKTVTLDAEEPAIGRVDVFFLADNTGSMGGILGAVRANAGSILADISGDDPRFAGLDVGFGVGRYLGDPSEGVTPTSAYQLQQSITTDATFAQAAIDDWFASGGGDTPEANFFALQQAATEGAATDSGISTGQDTGWRDDAARVIVWFGDASSHTETVDQTEVIDALESEGVIVAAINTQPAGFGIDTLGQASAIATATGGTLANDVDTTGVTDAILDAIEAALSSIDLNFFTAGDTSGINVAFTCTDPLGCDDVEPGESRTFNMLVTGVTPGVYNFEARARSLGGAVELDTITVTGILPPPTDVPEPATIALMAAGLLGLGLFRRERRR